MADRREARSCMLVLWLLLSCQTGKSKQAASRQLQLPTFSLLVRHCSVRQILFDEFRMEESNAAKTPPRIRSASSSPSPQKDSEEKKSSSGKRGRISSAPSKVRYFFQQLGRDSKDALGHKKGQLLQVFDDCSRKVRRRSSEAEAQPFVDINENNMATSYGTVEHVEACCAEPEKSLDAQFAGKAATKKPTVAEESRVWKWRRTMRAHSE